MICCLRDLHDKHQCEVDSMLPAHKKTFRKVILRKTTLRTHVNRTDYHSTGKMSTDLKIYFTECVLNNLLFEAALVIQKLLVFLWSFFLDLGPSK